MTIEKAARRTFLRQGLGAVAAAGAAEVIAPPERAQAKQAKPKKKVVSLPGAQPAPSALFSPGIQLGNLLFVSGQGARDPKTGKFPEGPFPDQVRQCLANIKAVLEAAGSSPERVLKCTVFLTDITNFQAMNEVYHAFFTSDPPARTTIAVKDLPGNSPVEIECFAATD
jgi:2-iminobutanoate/2-iminopropanoate deaminase